MNGSWWSTAAPSVGSVGFDQAIEQIPRDTLQKPVKHAIVMHHGIDPPLMSGSFPNVQNRVESMPCILYSKTQPDGRALFAEMKKGELHTPSMAGLKV